MDFSVFDIETDGLLETVTKIHCICVIKVLGNKVTSFSIINYDEMKEFLMNEETLVGHNIIRFDIPVIKKILGIEPTARLIDTLPLSWYLYPGRLKHGLEEWGSDFGIEKPKIVDWSNQTVEDYIYRCSEDAKINFKLFDLQGEYLFTLYNHDGAKVDRLIGYLMFKMQCAAEQEEVKWKLDIDICRTNLEYLKSEMSPKVEQLANAMPMVTKYRIAARPKVMQKKDGSVSALGEKWYALLKEHGLPDYHIGSLKIPVSQVKGNPGSHAQLKAWLFTLGWIPATFKYEKQEDGSNRKIPQLSNSDGNDICDSVKLLYEAHPVLEAIEGLFVLKHRIGILEGFLENVDANGYLKAEIKGLTNTLRFQHTTIVNLPTIPKPYWEKVRGCLIAPDDEHLLCGSDMSGLEDSTKRHYMYYYDPEYVKEMMEYGFDPHCDIAVLANKMSKDEEVFFKWYDKKKEGKDYQKILDIYKEKNFPFEVRMKSSVTNHSLDMLLVMSAEDQAKQIKILKPIRLRNKKVNFAGVYGAGAAKIALTAGMPLPEAKLLHITYWKRNWAVKKVAESCIVKVVGGQMWLLNPVAQLWYSLRVEKDKFSTLNQGTGVYAFDSWVRNIRKQGIRLCGQFHDEIVFPFKKGDEQQIKEKLTNAIDWTNQELQLNVVLGISIDFGKSYADVH